MSTGTRSSADGESNPVLAVVADSVFAGKVWDRETIDDLAGRVADRLAARGLDVGEWSAAVARELEGQSPSDRRRAKELVDRNRSQLATLAPLLYGVTTLYSIEPDGGPDRVTEAALQFVRSPPESLGRSLLHPAFLGAGRLGALPPRVSLPLTLGTDERSLAPPDFVGVRSKGPERLLARLDSAMSEQWGFLHERAAVSSSEDLPLNVNTLTRYAYNSYGVKEILADLDHRGVENAAVLLVTGYETPVHELLSSPRVGRVVVIDIARRACSLVGEKYARHPGIAKLSLELADYSGLEPRFQEAEADRLGALCADGTVVPGEALREHFARIAEGSHREALPFATEEFDAVHLPFVMGSVHFGAITIALERYRTATRRHGFVDYEEFLGATALDSAEATQATIASLTHGFRETDRITKRGGLVVANMWIRPWASAPHELRVSGVPISPEAFDHLMRGYERKFSGNPQPTLPHTVGHIFEARVR